MLGSSVVLWERPHESGSIRNVRVFLAVQISVAFVGAAVAAVMIVHD